MNAVIKAPFKQHLINTYNLMDALCIKNAFSVNIELFKNVDKDIFYNALLRSYRLALMVKSELFTQILI